MAMSAEEGTHEGGWNKKKKKIDSISIYVYYTAGGMPVVPVVVFFFSPRRKNLSPFGLLYTQGAPDDYRGAALPRENVPLSRSHVKLHWDADNNRRRSKWP